MTSPVVSILMGSHSDLEVMKESAEILKKFEIPYEISVISAHRMPHKLFDYAQNLLPRGIEVVIAGAGGAAHLPGVIASLTPIPVIGVPIRTSTLDGLDSLLSIVQMPSGIPVATVAINGAKNAALLAVEILSLKDRNLREKIIAYRKEMVKEIERKSLNI